MVLLLNFHKTKTGRKIAYVKTKGIGPGIVFLSGFMSDMSGTKALHLEAMCKEQGLPFLRFDYSGHGKSSGNFVDGCIGDWTDDAQDLLENVFDGQAKFVNTDRYSKFYRHTCDLCSLEDMSF